MDILTDILTALGPLIEKHGGSFGAVTIVGLFLVYYGHKFGAKWLDSVIEERKAMLAEVTAARTQTQTLAGNHMAHLQESHEKFMEFQTSVTALLGAISKEMNEHADRSEREHRELREKMEKLRDDVNE